MPAPQLQILTATGAGGVALLRLSGPGAGSLLADAFCGRPPAVGDVAYGELQAGGERIDDVLLTRTAAEAYELGCHAGPAVQRRVSAALEALGAVPAPPPQSVAAEVELALGQALSARACRALLAQPALWAKARTLSDDLEHARAQVAALQRSRLSQRLIRPSRVALRGAPNAGKSSLLNAWVGRTRAIVSPLAGTTRDAVTALTVVAGLPVLLVDTAGDHVTPDPLERAGIERARAAAATATLRVVLVEGNAALPSWVEAEPEPRLVVRSKADRVATADRVPGLWVSAHTSEGLPDLERALDACLLPANLEGQACAFTQRLADWVARAAVALESADLAAARSCLERAWSEDPPPVTRL